MIRSACIALAFVLLVCLAGAVGDPTSAGAATLGGTLSCSGPHGECWDGDLKLELVAERGERNAVTVTADAPVDQPLWRIQDTGADLVVAASSRCTAVDAHTATCPGGRPDVDLGDGDDTFRIVGWRAADVTVSGGAGSDVIDVSNPSIGDRFHSYLVDGGLGDDVIVGSGSDTIVLSPGHDRIERVDDRWGERLRGPQGQTWDVDLAAGVATHGEDRTELSGVSAAQVDHGTLLGDERTNWLSTDGPVDGRGGDDFIGGAGTVVGGTGDDDISTVGTSTVDAGTGNDIIQIGMTGIVALTCGPGVDRVGIAPQAAPRLDDTCEVISVGEAGDVAGQPTEGRNRVSVRISCVLRTSACRGRLSVAGLPGPVAYTLSRNATKLVRIFKRGHRPRRLSGRIRVSVKARTDYSSSSWWAPPRRVTVR